MDFCGVFFLFEFSLASGNDKVGCIVRVVPFATDFPIPSPEPFLINWTQENLIFLSPKLSLECPQLNRSLTLSSVQALNRCSCTK